MTYIAVLIAVHNRKIKTLECLEHLFAQKNIDEYQIEVYLTDDGCTDGTPEAIRTQFPSVCIVQGDGTLFWNRGMHRAWQAASKTKDYDFYLWLNDDTMLFEYALNILLDTAKQFKDKSIIVGTTSATCKLDFTYGGREKNGKIICPENMAIECHHFNGNIVLIPRQVYLQIGMNDPFFHHALGDFDYGMRATKLGLKSYIAPSALGFCDLHENLPTWSNPEKRLGERLKAFRTPLGQNPEEFFVFEKRHEGLGKAVFHYATNHLRVIWPNLWKNNV